MIWLSWKLLVGFNFTDRLGCFISLKDIEVTFSKISSYFRMNGNVHY